MLAHGAGLPDLLGLVLPVLLIFAVVSLAGRRRRRREAEDEEDQG